MSEPEMVAPEVIQQPQLLSDDPADVDELGSHQRVADGIAKLVLSNDGGKAITLEGAWGSGKSTVIKLLEKLLGRAEWPAEFTGYPALHFRRMEPYGRST